MIGFSFPQFHEYIKNSLNLYTLSFQTLRWNIIWSIKYDISSYFKKTRDIWYSVKKYWHLWIFIVMRHAFCVVYMCRYYFEEIPSICLSILLADVYSYLICLLHSNVNSSHYKSKWMTCAILIIMIYFIICSDRSCNDNSKHWNQLFSFSLMNSMNNSSLLLRTFNIIR